MNLLLKGMLNSRGRHLGHMTRPQVRFSRNREAHGITLCKLLGCNMSTQVLDKHNYSLIHGFPVYMEYP